MRHSGRAHLEGTPEDIIRMIFEQGYADELSDHIGFNFHTRGTRNTVAANEPGHPRTFSFAVSHVSRRFRHIALSLPSLWTCISSELTTIDELHMIIDRSRNRGLTIYLGAFRKKLSVQTFMELICQCPSRWKNLHVAYEKAPISLHQALSHVDHHFPALEKLYYFLQPGVRVGVHSTADVTKWKMPRLSSFSGNTFLGAGLGEESTGSLALVVENVMSEALQTTSFLGFCASLSSYRHLETLSLEFHEPMRVDDFLLHQFPIIELPSLREVNYTDSYGPLLAWDFLLSIRAPTLEILRLDIEIQEDYPGHVTMENLNQYTTHFPSIQHLSVDFMHGGAFDIAAATQNLKNLRILELANLKLAPSSNSFAAPPSLRSLQLASCSGLTERFIQDVSDFLRMNDGPSLVRIIRTGPLDFDLAEDFIKGLQNTNSRIEVNQVIAS